MTYLSKTNRRNTTSVSNAILQFHLLIYFAKREKPAAAADAVATKQLTTHPLDAQ